MEGCRGSLHAIHISVLSQPNLANSAVKFLSGKISPDGRAGLRMAERGRVELAFFTAPNNGVGRRWQRAGLESWHVGTVQMLEMS